MAAKKTITVQQIASANRRPAVQTKTLRGLGLDKLHRTRDAGGHSGRPRHDQQYLPPGAHRRRAGSEEILRS